MEVTRMCRDCKNTFVVHALSPAQKCVHCQDRDQSYKERAIQDGMGDSDD